jgi:hypothetical protein
MISESALEAEVLITDGLNELVCFSQPCNLMVNQRITEPVYCFNNKNVVRAANEECHIEKQKEALAYNLVGKLADKKNNLVKVGEIMVQLEQGSIPKDILENEYISFYCQRIDIY